jgi:integrase
MTTSLFSTCKPSVSKQNHRSGKVSWRVLIGRNKKGSGVYKNFKTEPEAKAYKIKRESFLQKNQVQLLDLDDVEKKEIELALMKANQAGVTLLEAVDFFLKFGSPDNGAISVETAVEMWLNEKRQRGSSEKHIRNGERTYFPPFVTRFKGRNTCDITANEAEEYIYSQDTWQPSSKAYHTKFLTGFYNFLRKNGYAKINPFKTVEIHPKSKIRDPKLLPNEVVRRLLQYSLDQKKYTECLAQVICFFCGIRIEEFTRLKWEKSFVEKKAIEISPQIAKSSKRRVLQIPDNALRWIKLLKIREGMDSGEKLLQQLKRIRRKALVGLNLKYPQNGMRHTFAGNHYAHFRDPRQTAYLMGHPDPRLVATVYHEFTTPELSSEYWQIVPLSVEIEMDEEARAKAKADDDESYAEAVNGSNCGKAVRIEGKWVSVQDESLF